ncbi:MAG: Rpn family recombination-promoting nuclease/putative transposase [Treponemataceae bacterium]|nr:Rpn family recombination-promoting nuclease/putative transposase [Treponemataceae bacterium]
MDYQNMSPEEKWETATLANKFFFYKIFTQNPDMCKKLIEILLHIEIEKITPPKGEQTFDVDFESHGIRLDVYVKNKDEVYDLEMQTVDTRELPKRARYYQGLMDVDFLKKGEAYGKLPKSYVIFLCMEDIFGQSLPVYTFNNVCKENNSLSLGDESYKIFFNAKMYDTMGSEAEKSFFGYLCNGTAYSDFTRQLDTLMSQARHNAQWRHQFMTWEQELNVMYHNGVDDGIKQGIEQGIERGAREKTIETVKNCLKEGLPLETISKLVSLSIEEIKKIEKANK